MIAEKIIFYLILLFLPTQLGRHFWPSFSYVLGIRVDYLAPTLYVTDLLILFLFIVFLLNILLNKRSLNFKLGSGDYGKFAAFVAFLSVGIVLSKNPLLGWYGLLKFLEFVFFGFYTASRIKVGDIKTICLIFSLGVFFESFLAILEYFRQGSISGLFYFFGERSFNSQTPGIANADINGALVLRPYGTFSHPNVLAGYLTIAMTMIVSSIKYQVLSIKNVIFWAALFIGTVALFLTLSRVAIFVWLAIIGLSTLNYLRKNLKKNKLVLLFFLFSTFYLLLSTFYLPLLGPRFTSISLLDESWVLRKELIKDSFLMVKSSPIFGVGINNFLVNLKGYYLQPVHNIYLLIASEAGLIGLLFFLWFIGKTVNRIRNLESGFVPRLSPRGIRGRQFIIHNSLFVILSIVLFLGLFDHYFLTLQQGQLLFSFVLGLCFVEKEG